LRKATILINRQEEMREKERALFWRRERERDKKAREREGEDRSWRRARGGVSRRVLIPRYTRETFNSPPPDNTRRFSWPPPFNQGWAEPGRVSKTRFGGSWIWKNVIKLEPKGSNFGVTWLKLVPEESSHQFINVRTEPEVLSKRRRTAQQCFQPCVYPRWSVIEFGPGYKSVINNLPVSSSFFDTRLNW
jgi:hypothetical protein